MTLSNVILAGAAVVVLAVIVPGIVAKTARAFLDGLRHDPYVAVPHYHYGTTKDGKPMDQPDVHLLNRIGKRRFEEIVAANSKVTKAERWCRRIQAARLRRTA